MDIKTVLREEIVNEVADLSKMQLGTDEYKTTVDGITKLADRVIEMDKIDAERNDKEENKEFDNDLKLRQAADERKDRIIKNLLTAVSIIIPAYMTYWGTVKSFEFEKEGTITTIMGRGFINKLLPKK